MSFKPQGLSFVFRQFIAHVNIVMARLAQCGNIVIACFDATAFPTMPITVTSLC
jgi:hypothetical protein